MKPLTGSGSIRILRFSHDAMNCTFELYVAGREPEEALFASREVFRLLDSLEGELSRYRPQSEISQLNAAPVGHGVRLSPAAWDCLYLAYRLHGETLGYFDVTMGALVTYFRQAEASIGSDSWAEARAASGMEQLILAPEHRAAGRGAEGLTVDLGAIGKGFALDRMAALLDEFWEISDFLLVSGGSSALARGHANGKSGGWGLQLDTASGVYTCRLMNNSFSGSAMELKGRHIIHPHSGEPVAPRHAAWAIAPSAAESDAFSTAFFLMGEDEVQALCAAREGLGAVLQEGPNSPPVALGEARAALEFS